MIIHLLGVPMDLGSGRRGVDMGPSAIRIAGVGRRLEEQGHKIPLGRLGQPSDIAQAVSFFAAVESSFITGQVLSVDGGETMY